MHLPVNRRTALLGLGSTLAVSSANFSALASTRVNIIIIGGGFGGASAASTLKRILPSANITLIERHKKYTACPFSNLVIAGERDLKSQEFNYATLEKRGINIIHADAESVSPTSKFVKLSDGSEISFDKLIISPGIDFRWNSPEGYTQEVAEVMPHAWKAGRQTTLLNKQLLEMEDGGLVVMSVPPAPFRCPPGPYERASMIAHFLKTQKPASKLLILDGNDRFSKMPLFMEAWVNHYPDHIEWRGASNDGLVSRVDTSTNSLTTDFEVIKADVANIIPAQKAGRIAERAGITDATGWCPINPIDFSSALQPDIYVLGDATIAVPMPKSAFSANLQAKICAIAIARELSGQAIEATILANTCYSYTSPDEAISVSGVYSNTNNVLASIEGAGGISPLNADTGIRNTEADQAKDWFRSITSEAFG